MSAGGADKDQRNSGPNNEASETIKDHIDILLGRIESEKAPTTGQDSSPYSFYDPASFEYDYSAPGPTEAPNKTPEKQSDNGSNKSPKAAADYSADDLASLSSSRRPGFEVSSSLRSYTPPTPSTTSSNLKAALSQVTNPKSPAAIFLDKRSHFILPVCLCLVASVTLYILVHRFERDSYFDRAQQLLKSGKAQGALPLFQKVIAFDSTETRAARGAGQACSHLKHWDMAAKYYEMALAQHPEDPNIVDEYGKVAMHLGKYRSALDAYNKMLSLQKDKPTNKQLHSRALLLAKVGRWNEALVDYAVILKRDAKDDDALAGMAFCKAKMGRFDEATENLDMVLNRSPEHVQARLLRGECYLYDKDFAKAQKDFSLVLKNQPDNVDGQLHMASLEVALGKKDVALSRLTTVVAKHQDSLDAHQALGDLLLPMKRFDAAVAEYQKVCSINKSAENLYSHIWNAQDLIRKHASQEALIATTDLIKVHPDFGRLYVIRSQAHAGLQNYGAAIADCATALKYSPGYPEALLCRARYHAFAGNTLSAMKDYQSAIQGAPAVVAPYVELANLEMSMQKFASAYKHFSTASSLDKSNQAAREGSNKARLAMRTMSGSSRASSATLQRSTLSKREIAEIAAAPMDSLVPKIYEALKAGRLDYVTTAGARAITLDPNSVLPRQYMLFALLKQGRLEAAESQLMALQKMGKANGKDVFGLTKSFIDLGQTQNAMRLLDEYLKAHPGDTEAIELLAQCYEQAGDFQKAKDLCNDGLKTAKSGADVSRMNRCLQHLKEVEEGSAAPDKPTPKFEPG